MTLHLHRAERADRFVDTLADVLVEPLADPFASEVVCVPTRGVERWLAQRLSPRLGALPRGRDGICSGDWFGSLRRLMTTAMSPVIPSPPTRRTRIKPAADRSVAPDHAVWPLLR